MVPMIVLDPSNMVHNVVGEMQELSRENCLGCKTNNPSCHANGCCAPMSAIIQQYFLTACNKLKVDQAITGALYKEVCSLLQEPNELDMNKEQYEPLAKKVVDEIQTLTLKNCDGCSNTDDFFRIFPSAHVYGCQLPNQHKYEMYKVEACRNLKVDTVSLPNVLSLVKTMLRI